MYRALRRPAPFLFLFFVATFAAPPAAATITDVGFTVSPEVPTWATEFSVVVSGESDCTVHVQRTEWHFGPPEGNFIDIDLREDCAGGERPGPFVAASPRFRRLDPGVYQVGIDLSGDDSLLAAGELTVRDQAFVIFPPPLPVADDQTIHYSFFGYTPACLPAAGPNVDGRSIVTRIRHDCPGDPPLSQVRFYDQSVGPLPAGDYELVVIVEEDGEERVVREPVHVFDSSLCVPGQDHLCLNGDRFVATVDWEAFDGANNVGHAVAGEELDDTGFFWFFRPDNVELTVKVLDGCNVNHHYWLFVASSTNVAWELAVDDLVGGGQRLVSNRLGEFAPLYANTTAFPCAP